MPAPRRGHAATSTSTTSTVDQNPQSVPATVPGDIVEALMKWLVDFYNERRALVVRYRSDAPLPPAAVIAGREALFIEHRIVKDDA
jgi:hypothetical protein